MAVADSTKNNNGSNKKNCWTSNVNINSANFNSSKKKQLGILNHWEIAGKSLNKPTIKIKDEESLG
jgi:hypothetical protein